MGNLKVSAMKNLWGMHGAKFAAIFTTSSLQGWLVIAAMLCWRGLWM